MALPPITLGALRPVWKKLRDQDSETQSVTVLCHPSIEADVRNLPNFTPVEKYSSEVPPDEIGKCERFRFVRRETVAAGQWEMIA